jgi:hypothetical protein
MTIRSFETIARMGTVLENQSKYFKRRATGQAIARKITLIQRHDLLDAWSR